MMTIWVPQLPDGRPRYLAIADAMKTDLQRGVLKPGDRLPTHRDLAFRLGVTTGTVTRAYAEAEKLGLLVGEVGRGSFLKQPTAEAAPFAPVRGTAGPIDLSQASPPPVHVSQDFDAALAQVMKSPGRLDLLDYTPPDGYPLHRAMGARWLARCGVEAGEQHVVVSAGAHAGLIATLATLCQAGDRMLVERLTYPTIKPIARLLGIELVPLEIDEGGLVPEALEKAAAQGQSRLLYVVPTLQNPTTATLSLERRAAITGIARRHGLTVIEDDIFRLLDPRLQPPPIQALAPERTYYITSLSKTLAPGLRVGFVAPPPGKAEAIMRHQSVAGGRAVGLAAEVARHWIESGTAERILSTITAENARRRDIAIDVFKGCNFACNSGSTYLWLKLPGHWHAGDFVRAAQDRGVRVSPGSAFAIGRSENDQAVRICFGGGANRDEFHGALRTLGHLLGEDHDGAAHHVA